MNAANTSVKYDATNAPRDPQELSLIGRFRLKDLALTLGLGATTETRAALANLDVPQLVSAVSTKLKEIDAAGGPPAPAAPVAPAYVAPPPPVTAAEAPASPRSPRSPRTSTAAAAAGGTFAVPPEVLALLPLVQALVDTVQKQGVLIQTLVSSASKTATALDELAFQQSLNTSLSLFFAEETLGGSRPQILEQAFADLPDIVALVGKARQG